MTADTRWQRYTVSFGSSAASVIRLPISCTVSMASLFHVPDVSIAIGANTCVEVMTVYSGRLNIAALFEAVPYTIDVSFRWDYNYYYCYYFFLNTLGINNPEG